jgi:hypothetical protein
MLYYGSPMIRVLSRFEHEKTFHLTDSNRLTPFQPCSNHSIDPHHGHLTSQRMEDQHSQYQYKPNSTS